MQGESRGLAPDIPQSTSLQDGCPTIYGAEPEAKSSGGARHRPTGFHPEVRVLQFYAPAHRCANTIATLRFWDLYPVANREYLCVEVEEERRKATRDGDGAARAIHTVCCIECLCASTVSVAFQGAALPRAPPNFRRRRRRQAIRSQKPHDPLGAAPGPRSHPYNPHATTSELPAAPPTTALRCARTGSPGMRMR